MISFSSRLVSWTMTACLLAVLTGVPSSQAADRWWDGGSVDIAGDGDGASGGTAGMWNTATLNWDQASGLPHVAWVNANNDTAIFGGTAGTVTLGVPVTANALTFNTAGYTIASGTLTLAGTTPTLTVNSNATISSVIAGSAGLIKAGTAALTLTGTNTYSGGTTVAAGKLIVGTNSAAGTGTITLSGGVTLSDAGYNATTLANAIEVTGTGNVFESYANGYLHLNGNLTGSGAVSTAGGSGIVSLRGDNSGFSGTFTSPAGVWCTVFNAASAGSSNANWVLNQGSGAAGGVFSAAGGTHYFGSLAGNGALQFQNASPFTLVVGGNNASTSFSGIIGKVNNNVAVTKVGTGTLTLAAVNTFTGTLAVNQGGLILGNGNNNANWYTGKPNIVVTNGATLSFAGSNIFGTVLANMSAVTVNGGTVLSSPDGADRVTLVNNLTLNSGTVSVNGNDATSTTWGVFGFGGTTTATGNSVINALPGKTGTIRDGNGNTPTFTVNTPSVSDTLTISVAMQNGLGALSLIKSGNGTLALAAPNAYTGSTMVSSGMLVLAVSGALSSSSVVLLNGGVLDAGVHANACGGLTLGGDSVLRLTTGCSLSFADSSSLVWSNAMLTVVGDFPRRAVRFGTSAAGLTPEQLLKIRYEDKPVSLDGEGYLAYPEKGTCIIIE